MEELRPLLIALSCVAVAAAIVGMSTLSASFVFGVPILVGIAAYAVASFWRPKTK